MRTTAYSQDRKAEDRRFSASHTEKYIPFYVLENKPVPNYQKQGRLFPWEHSFIPSLLPCTFSHLLLINGMRMENMGHWGLIQYGDSCSSTENEY